MLEDGSLHNLLDAEYNNRQTFEYSKNTAARARKNEAANKKRYTSHEIKFKNLSSIRTSLHDDDTKELKLDGLAVQRNLMGQSVEWGNMPFEFDSIANGSILSNPDMLD